MSIPCILAEESTASFVGLPFATSGTGSAPSSVLSVKSLKLLV